MEPAGDPGRGAAAGARRLLNDWRLHAFFLLLLACDIVAVVAGGVFELMYWESKFHDAEDRLIACVGEGARRLGGGHGPAACDVPGHYGNELYHDAERALIEVSIAILCVFVLEHLVMLFAMGARYFTQGHHVLDFLIILTSLVMEVMALTHTLYLSVGVVIASRLWRFARIIHGTTEVVQDLEEELAGRLTAAAGGGQPDDEAAPMK